MIPKEYQIKCKGCGKINEPIEWAKDKQSINLN